MSNYPAGVTQLALDRYYRSTNCQLCGEALTDEDFDAEICNACSDRLDEEVTNVRDAT